MGHSINKITTLCYIINHKNEVLLIMKKRDFGAGKWNGPGGKVKPNENPMAAAIREVKEEVDIKVKMAEELGCMEFIWPDQLKNWNQRCYVYLAREFSGQPKESDECRPAWFSLNQIPYDQMWDDDKYWYPDALAGKKFKKRFYFDKDNKVIKFENI